MTSKAEPHSSAARVALWRALHLELEAPPHVFVDPVGLQLLSPPEDWRQRPDMHPLGTRGYRASIIGRSRLIEDLVAEVAELGIDQYVLLGAGLDTFTQRKPELASRYSVFEIDQRETLDWKRARLIEVGFGIPSNLHLVPVDFERNESWIEKLIDHQFDIKKPAILSSAGVSMYLTHEANLNMLKEIASLATGSTLALTFLLPLEFIEASERAQHQMVYERARAAGTPFVSFFRPNDIVDLAKSAGFKKCLHISREEIINRYFKDRIDGFQPASGEEFLIATC